MFVRADAVKGVAIRPDRSGQQSNRTVRGTQDGFGLVLSSVGSRNDREADTAKNSPGVVGGSDNADAGPTEYAAAESGGAAVLAAWLGQGSLKTPTVLAASVPIGLSGSASAPETAWVGSGNLSAEPLSGGWVGSGGNLGFGALAATMAQPESLKADPAIQAVAAALNVASAGGIPAEFSSASPGLGGVAQGKDQGTVIGGGQTAGLLSEGLTGSSYGTRVGASGGPVVPPESSRGDQATVSSGPASKAEQTGGTPADDAGSGSGQGLRIAGSFSSGLHLPLAEPRLPAGGLRDLSGDRWESPSSQGLAKEAASGKLSFLAAGTSDAVTDTLMEVGWRAGMGIAPVSLSGQSSGGLSTLMGLHGYGPVLHGTDRQRHSNLAGLVDPHRTSGANGDHASPEPEGPRFAAGSEGGVGIRGVFDGDTQAQGFVRPSASDQFAQTFREATQGGGTASHPAVQGPAEGLERSAHPTAVLHDAQSNASVLEGSVSWLASKHGGVATIDLSPPELGGLRLELKVDPSGTSATLVVHAASDAARLAVEQALDRLYEAFQGSNMSLSVSVGTGAGNFTAYTSSWRDQIGRSGPDSDTQPKSAAPEGEGLSELRRPTGADILSLYA